MSRRVLNEDELIFNLHTYFTTEKNNGGPLRSVSSVHGRVCDALGIGDTKLKTVLRNVKSGNNQVNSKTYKPRKKLKTSDMPDGMKFKIRDQVYEMRDKKEHVSVNTLMEKLREKQIFDIGRTSLWKVLKEIGFKYKMEDNRKYLCERSNVVHKRIQFLRQYSRLKEEGASFIFLDETWIFSKGATTRIWQDDNIKSVKHTGDEGKRHIILHAGGKNGFVTGADLIFSTKSKSADYHDNMNTEMFIKWLKEKLLPHLSEPSVIVLDNAPYHSEILNKPPRQSWTVGKIKDWLLKENIAFPEYALKSELLNIAKRHEPPPIYIVDDIIHSFGHQVLRLPPYHCEFNPIEHIWGISKTYYNNHIGITGYSDEAVQQIWKQALDTATPDVWQKSIKKCEELIDNWWARENRINEINPIIIRPNDVSDTSSESDHDGDFEDV